VESLFILSSGFFIALFRSVLCLSGIGECAFRLVSSSFV